MWNSVCPGSDRKLNSARNYLANIRTSRRPSVFAWFELKVRTQPNAIIRGIRGTAFFNDRIGKGRLLFGKSQSGFVSVGLSLIGP